MGFTFDVYSQCWLEVVAMVIEEVCGVHLVPGRQGVGQLTQVHGPLAAVAVVQVVLLTETILKHPIV